MTEDQLINELRKRYQGAPEGKRVVALHLFAIEYAGDLESRSLARIAEAATGRRSYGTELRKGINLSPFVTVKDRP